MTKERVNEILGLLLFALGVFLLLSFITYQPEDMPFYAARPNDPIQNAGGLIGATVAFGIFYTFGHCGFLFPLVLLFWSVCLFLQRVPDRLMPKLVGFLFMQVSLSSILALLQPLEDKFSAGGVLGYAISTFLNQYLGFSGTLVYGTLLFLISFLLATEFLLYEILVVAAARVGLFFSHLKAFAFSRVKIPVAESKPPKIKSPKVQAAEAKMEEKAKDQEKKELKVSALRDIELKIKKYEDQIKHMGKGEKGKEKQTVPSVSKDKGEEELSLREVQRALKASVKELDEEAKNFDEEEGIVEAKTGQQGNEEENANISANQSIGATLGTEGESAVTASSEEMDEMPDEVLADQEPKYQFVSIGSEESDDADFELPPSDLLSDPVLADGMTEDLRENSKVIEQRLKDFDIDVKVTEVEQGPVITRYEVLPAPGIKLSRIVGLQDDIALAMKTTSIRIAPVQGKSTIGIELPNSVSNMVYLKELTQSPGISLDKFALPLFLGKNTSGKPLISDLAEMPHMLIAGTTGSGKTVCLNAIIAGLLCRLKPSELRFVMIDPKMVELACYADIPHLAAPVVTDTKKAPSVLNWVVAEMENRYRLLASVAVRNIKGFNTRTRSASEKEKRVPDLLPYIVVVIDELADLMMTAQDKVEGAIARLAQLSRAVGIHLILATQRPSVDVITGVIKANFPARISFKVASKIDSRTVLDAMGADKLLGKGDMLFLEPGHGKPTRAQSAYISDKELRAVVRHLKSQKGTEYLKELEDLTAGKISPAMLEKDDMYDEAVRIILDTGQASVSVLQRRLRLGYGRAARIIDMMEAAGIVGPFQGSKPREILVKREEMI